MVERHIVLAFRGDNRFTTIPAGAPYPVIHRPDRNDEHQEPMIRSRAFDQFWAPIYTPILARIDWPSTHLKLACCGR